MFLKLNAHRDRARVEGERRRRRTVDSLLPRDTMEDGKTLRRNVRAEDEEEASLVISSLVDWARMDDERVVYRVIPERRRYLYGSMRPSLSVFDVHYRSRRTRGTTDAGGAISVRVVACCETR
jgi:hypothetical protein